MSVLATTRVARELLVFFEELEDAEAASRPPDVGSWITTKIASVRKLNSENLKKKRKRECMEGDEGDGSDVTKEIDFNNDEAQ